MEIDESRINPPHVKLISFKEAIEVTEEAPNGIKNEARMNQRTLPLRDPVGPLYQQPPEMINKCYDEKCDVWSIGIALYFILCGDLPFYCTDDAKAKYKILNGRLFFRCKCLNLHRIKTNA